MSKKNTILFEDLAAAEFASSLQEVDLANHGLLDIIYAAAER